MGFFIPRKDVINPASIMFRIRVAGVMALLIIILHTLMCTCHEIAAIQKNVTGDVTYIYLLVLGSCVAADSAKALIRIITISTKLEEQRKNNITLYCVCNYTDRRNPVIAKLLDKPSPIGMSNPLHSSSVSYTAIKYVYVRYCS